MTEFNEEQVQSKNIALAFSYSICLQYLVHTYDSFKKEHVALSHGMLVHRNPGQLVSF